MLGVTICILLFCSIKNVPFLIPYLIYQYGSFLVFKLIIS
nr:MAG TPA: hypothetical protein [Caudoviricetes sp.]